MTPTPQREEVANPFREYAQHYDLLYRDKEYPAEARFVARLLDRFTRKPPGETRILDLACGTGRHSQELERMGYRVEGSDISSDMVAVAAETAAKLRLPIVFHNESFQTADRIGGEFDAVIAMFSAIDYLTDPADLRRALANVRGLLSPGGVFIFDFWNGDAVVRSYSPRRVKHMEEGDLAITRTSNTTLALEAQTATIDFDFSLRRGEAVVREFSERHVVRYFMPDEMAGLLAENGFELLHRCPFLKEDASIETTDWNLAYVARSC